MTLNRAQLKFDFLAKKKIFCFVVLREKRFWRYITFRNVKNGDNLYAASLNSVFYLKNKSYVFVFGLR